MLVISRALQKIRRLSGKNTARNQNFAEHLHVIREVIKVYNTWLGDGQDLLAAFMACCFAALFLNNKAERRTGIPVTAGISSHILKLAARRLAGF